MFFFMLYNCVICDCDLCDHLVTGVMHLSYVILHYTSLFKIKKNKKIKENKNKSNIYNSDTIYIAFLLYTSPIILKSCSSTISSFFYFLTFVFNFLSNFVPIFFIFSKSSSLSHILYFTMNLFYYTRYFTILFILFNIFFISYFPTLFISTGFASFTFYFFISFLYLTILLIFTTR